MRERLLVQIDGSNFFKFAKRMGLKHLTYFKYNEFANYLSGGREIVAKRYYGAPIREEVGNPKSRELMRHQQKAFSEIRNLGWGIREGSIMKTDDYHEKGVDVLIATDMLIGAYEKLYDTIILVSSDTDLLPAIKQAKKVGIKIEYVGFSHHSPDGDQSKEIKPSFGLIQNTVARILTINDMKPFEGTVPALFE